MNDCSMIRDEVADYSSAPKMFNLYVRDTPSNNNNNNDWRKLLSKEIFHIEYNPIIFQIPSHLYQEEALRYSNVVRLEILSNYGHPLYTCLYKLKVHGTP
jgi:hypothetical protein